MNIETMSWDAGTQKMIAVDNSNEEFIQLDLMSNGNNTVLMNFLNTAGMPSNRINVCKGIIIGVATENSVSFPLRAWPNPVVDFLNVTYFGSESLNLELYDLQGHRLQIWNHDQQLQQLNLSAFSEGMYLLKVRGKSGVLRRVVKIIKAK